MLCVEQKYPKKVDIQSQILTKQRFVGKGDERKVLRLNKSLYGLKLAPRAWNKRIDNFMQQMSYSK